MRKIFVFAGLLAAPAGVALKASSGPAGNQAPQDPRVSRLAEFFGRRGCSLEKLSLDFIEAADENHLDWRLLPGISMVESSGGKAFKNNNIFGWRSGEERFSSVRSSIHLMAWRLSNSKLYRRKDTDGILKTYNPYSSYTHKVKAVMKAIGPADREPRLLLTSY